MVFAAHTSSQSVGDRESSHSVNWDEAEVPSAKVFLNAEGDLAIWS
jgi:hypothetical protein